MEDKLIGTVKIRLYINATGCVVSFSKKCMNELNTKEIIFIPFSLKIYIPTIDSKKTYKVSKWGSISFAHKTIPNEEFVGIYKMYKKDKYYYLKNRCTFHL